MFSKRDVQFNNALHNQIYGNTKNLETFKLNKLEKNLSAQANSFYCIVSIDLWVFNSLGTEWIPPKESIKGSKVILILHKILI